MAEVLREAKASGGAVLPPTEPAVLGRAAGLAARLARAALVLRATRPAHARARRRLSVVDAAAAAAARDDDEVGIFLSRAV